MGNKEIKQKGNAKYSKQLLAEKETDTPSGEIVNPYA